MYVVSMAYALFVFYFSRYILYFTCNLNDCMWLFWCLCDCKTLFVCLFAGFCWCAAFSACMCVERVRCDIFFRLHIYFPLYDYNIVFARVGLESTTFYGCFVWLCLFEAICQDVIHMCAWSKYALRYSKATDFTIMSLYTMSVLFLSLLFAGSLFRYIQIVYIAICGLNILLDTWYSLFFVCCCQLCVFVLLCVFFFCFTRVFFCVCHYILCH